MNNEQCIIVDERHYTLFIIHFTLNQGFFRFNAKSCAVS